MSLARLSRELMSRPSLQACKQEITFWVSIRPGRIVKPDRLPWKYWANLGVATSPPDGRREERQSKERRGGGRYQRTKGGRRKGRERKWQVGQNIAVVTESASSWSSHPPATHRLCCQLRSCTNPGPHLRAPTHSLPDHLLCCALVIQLCSSSVRTLWTLICSLICPDSLAQPVLPAFPPPLNLIF